MFRSILDMTAEQLEAHTETMRRIVFEVETDYVFCSEEDEWEICI